jgi:putative transposase
MLNAHDRLSGPCKLFSRRAFGVIISILFGLEILSGLCGFGPSLIDRIIRLSLPFSSLRKINARLDGGSARKFVKSHEITFACFSYLSARRKSPLKSEGIGGRNFSLGRKFWTKRSRFTDSQIMAALKRREAGEGVPDLCREIGISTATFCKWQTRFGGVDGSTIPRMRLIRSPTCKTMQRTGCGPTITMAHTCLGRSPQNSGWPWPRSSTSGSHGKWGDYPQHHSPNDARNRDKGL